MLLQKLLWPRVGICTEDRLYYRMKAPSFRDEGDILRIEQGEREDGVQPERQRQGEQQQALHDAALGHQIVLGWGFNGVCHGRSPFDAVDENYLLP